MDSYFIGLQSVIIIISSHAAVVYSLASGRSNMPFLYPRILTFQLLLLHLKSATLQLPVLNPLCREFIFQEVLRPSDPVSVCSC